MTDYRGPATIDGITVEVHLSARFEPIEGQCRWAGRAAPNEALTRKQRSGQNAQLAIGQNAAEIKLSEPDPWGRVRISGQGHPPWPAAPGD
ncbi:DUF4873 domain-containing protein [Symbioplanes lichenis]|uniref:DUF4873 domain-containing protein n=1 Tax=Symbioplanes lichenis TaxID=1629072 RepID=UPI0027385624|nr:DUF4873 domain-containing protein [Actinoplanes lichenis]